MFNLYNALLTHVKKKEKKLNPVAKLNDSYKNIKNTTREIRWSINLDKRLFTETQHIQKIKLKKISRP